LEKDPCTALTVYALQVTGNLLVLPSSEFYTLPSIFIELLPSTFASGLGCTLDFPLVCDHSLITRGRKSTLLLEGILQTLKECFEAQEKRWKLLEDMLNGVELEAETKSIRHLQDDVRPEGSACQ
jgi:hypothetical protein